MAKYSKQYSANRKVKTGKKVLDGLTQMGPDGNPIIKQDTNSPYQQPTQNNNGLTTGQYVGAGTALAAGTGNSINTFNNPNSTIRQKSESMDGTVAGTAGAINPVVGGIIGAGDAIGKPIRTGLEKTDANGNLLNENGAQAGAIIGSLFDPVKALTTRASYQGGWTDWSGKGYTNALEKEAKDALPKAPAPVFNKDYQQDAAWQKLNNQNQMASGGPLNEGQKVAYNKWLKTNKIQETDDYDMQDYWRNEGFKNDKHNGHFPDTYKKLAPFSEGDGYMQLSDESKYSGNPGYNSNTNNAFDKRGTGTWMGNNFSAYKLGGPMNNNLTRYDGGFKHADNDNENTEGGIPIGGDSVVEKGETRGMANSDSKDYIFSDTLKVPGKKYTFAKASKMIENKYSKRDNDPMSKEAMEKEISSHMNSQEELRNKMMDSAYKRAYGKGGPIHINPANKGKFNATKARTGETTEELTHSSNPVTRKRAIFAQNASKWHHAEGGPIGNITTSNEPVNNYPFYQEQNGKYYTGNMKMTPSAFSTANKQGNQRLPYTSEISADEYNKNLGTGNMFPAYNSPANTVVSPQSDYRMTGGKNGVPAYYFKGETPINENEYIKQTQAKPFGMGGKMRYDNGSYLPPMDVPEDPTLKPFKSYQPQNAQTDTNNFDPNTIYNAGNFLGGAYDIYRGAQGGAPVNYERVTPDTVNPELVNYQASRDLNRRDINEGFSNTQKDLRNVNNPAQYLSLLTQSAGSRDKTISDSNAKSYENEINANSQIRNQTNQFNAQTKNQGKYFNAQTQLAEANARQQEKDIASNTVQAGLASFGEALAGTGRDKQYNISQAESKKFIGSSDFSPILDKSGKITGYKHKTSGKIYNIQG